jgi:ABC-type proline/glycine betaine transport system permease subunit
MKRNWKKEYRNIIFNFLFIILTLLAILTLHDRVLTAFIVLTLLSVVALVKWNSKITLIIFICVSIARPVCEIAAIKFGLWSYSNISIFDVPLWLFPLWGATASSIYQLAYEIKKLHIAKK